MKRTLAALAILTILVAGISYGVANLCVRRVAAGGGVVDLSDAAWLKRELKLTNAQGAEIDKLNKEFGARLGRCCDDHCSARIALGQELAKPQVDLTKAAACVDRMTAAQSESERATLDLILRVRAVLTPAQQQQYGALVSKQVCMAGPMGMRQP